MTFILLYKGSFLIILTAIVHVIKKLENFFPSHSQSIVNK